MCIYLSLSAASGRSDGQGPDTGKQHGEKLPGDGHLRHLEDRPPGVAYDLGPYLISLSWTLESDQWDTSR